MKLPWLMVMLIVVNMGCAPVPSSQFTVEREEAPSAEYRRALVQAQELRDSCNKLFQGTSLSEMMKSQKGVIDARFEVTIKEMELFVDLWETTIPYPELILPRFLIEKEKQGINLLNEAGDDCIKSGMQTIKANGGQTAPGFEELLNYYTVYVQAYRLCKEPTGSLMSYRETLNNLKNEALRYSSKLDIILQ